MQNQMRRRSRCSKEGWAGMVLWFEYDKVRNHRVTVGIRRFFYGGIRTWAGGGF